MRSARHLPRLALALAAVACAPCALADEPVPEAVPITPEMRRFDEILEAMRLTEEESAWTKVGWLPSFGDAVARAREEGRPIFLWAMNGHPLGCV